ncbi:MAG: PD-(D/E)XK nuclease family protein [Candidatus Latescibacteria bacterium]|nr:PD-(D/E)XK nuclease family protein [Candidatus Latescibacterota bacterium]
MRWSYSASRSFRQCQRQWFFKNVAVSARAKDPSRRRAHLLGKLQSISAWRGRIVDDVLSKTLIPNLNRGVCLTLQGAKNRARGLFDRQLAYARQHPIADLGLQVSKEGDDFAVFHAMEYEGELSEHEIERAWCDVETALVNLFSLDDIKRILKSSDYIVSQRALQFTLMDDVTVLAYPDVIAFRGDAPPTIIDWKVHAFGTNDAWLQLAIYAIALSRCRPHRDFPSGFETQPQESALYEVQLLTNVVRKHSLEEEQIVEAEEYMLSSAYEIACLTEGRKYADLNVEDFRGAAYEETCQRCAFRAICWEKSHVH